MNQSFPPLTDAADRRVAVLRAVRHQRTARAALSILQARGVSIRVERPNGGVAGPFTKVGFTSGVMHGVWADWHAAPGHNVTITHVPLHMLSTLFQSVPVAVDQEAAGHDQPEDFQGDAAQYLREACGGLLAGVRWELRPGSCEWDRDYFTSEFETHWLGVAIGRVTLSGPGTDADAKVEFRHLREHQAHSLMEAYAGLAATQTA
ncbi:hypothetical protein ACFYWP_37105 [Actinacidiphila glaucinigra]|uniref:hypothetical protein n=1 Tax=Actinacidiphila glaucinigra TaxID=235986 RepID=UPI00369043E9